MTRARILRRVRVLLALFFAAACLLPRSVAAAPTFSWPITPSNVRTALADSAACAQSAWTINPSTGSDSSAGGSTAPLRTAQELSHRLAGCVVDTQVTVSISGALGSTDWITTPSIGPAGYVVVDCQPGATTLVTSSLTGASAQSGNSAATVTDSATDFSTACGGGSCVGYRLRITSGARAGTIAWIVYVQSTHVVTVSTPMLDGWIASPSKRPGPNLSASALPTQALAATDPYVIEKLALVNVPSFAGWIVEDQSAYDYSKLLFHSCSFSETVQYPTYASAVLAEVSVPGYGNPAAVSFVGSYPGFITGALAAYASLWDDYGFGGTPEDNRKTYGFGLAILGDAHPNGGAFYQGSLIQESCGPTCPYAGGSSSAEVGTTNLNSSGLGELGGLLEVQPGAVISVNGSNGLWGSGSSGVCAHVQSGAGLYSSVAVTCGDAGALDVGGTTLPWTSFVDAGGSVVRGAYAGYQN